MTVMTARDLYERDFFEWTRCNAALLRAHRFEQVDIEHIAEEIEDMGKSQQRELESRIQVLLAHLLKWKHQPGRRSLSWEHTVDNQRDEIERLIRMAPSLRNYIPAALSEVHPKAVRDAAKETRLPQASFPETCPFTPDQILAPDFFPE